MKAGTRACTPTYTPTRYMLRPSEQGTRENLAGNSPASRAVPFSILRAGVAHAAMVAAPQRTRASAPRCGPGPRAPPPTREASPSRSSRRGLGGRAASGEAGPPPVGARGAPGRPEVGSTRGAENCSDQTTPIEILPCCPDVPSKKPVRGEGGRAAGGQRCEPVPRISPRGPL